MSEMLWDQAFEGRRSPKTILSTDNKRLSWRICLWGLLKTRHIHLLLLSKCWHPVEAHGLWTPWPHRMLGPQEFLSLKSINYSLRILLKAWEDMDGMGILKMSSVRVRPAGSWTTHLLTSWLLGKASGHKACRILIPRPGITPAILAWQGKVLTTGLPGKSHTLMFLRQERSTEFKVLKNKLMLTAEIAILFTEP